MSTTHTPTPSLPLLAGVLLLRTVLLFAGSLIFSTAFGSWNRGLLYANVTIVAVDVITLAIVAQLQHRRGSTLRALLAPRLRDTGWGLLCFLIVTIGFLVATFVGNLIAYLGPPPASPFVWTPPLWLGIWTITIMPITIALAEEALYRGYAQQRLAERFPTAIAIIIVAAFFGLQHAALTPLDWQAQLARFITTFLLGLLFGLLAYLFKRLWPLVIGHWLLDVLGLGLPMLLAGLNS